MNLAPELYALNPQSLRETALLDLNPQFALMKFARVEEIQWRGTDGQLDKGGLYYPVDYSVGKRYPLVIQTHDWSPDQFLIDGPFTTAFAAQPLAGLGIMVLQTGQITSEFGKPGELTSNMSMFEGAIDDLDERGLIDRNHVGIIGFSRTCLHVKYALAHSRYRFEAASVTDGFDAGYLQYILALPSNSGFTEDVEDINGGAPFGNLERWMQRSVGFVVSQVRTPLRINALTNTSVLGEWEWFAALSRLSRPVEMVVIEDGSHLLEKPWDREISQQGNVDWFRFWLRNEEDPDPTKADQYSRWRELRNLERY
jgi:dipeptidyl aminopeptidase/acylaminoacyl peptidase